MNPGLRLFSIVVLAGLLAACGAPPQNREVEVVRPGSEPRPQPKSARKEAAEMAEEVVMASPAVTNAVAMDPRRLLGLDQENLAAILGAPRFVRRDATVQLWRYRNDSCVLHVFFYRDDDNDENKMTVRHYEARNLRGVPAGASDCLNKLLASRHE